MNNFFGAHFKNGKTWRFCRVLPVLVFVSALSGCTNRLDIYLLSSENPDLNVLLNAQEGERINVRIESTDSLSVGNFEYSSGKTANIPDVLLGGGRILSVAGVGGIIDHSGIRRDAPYYGKSLPLTLSAGENSLEIFVGAIDEFTPAAPSLNPDTPGMARGGHHALTLTDGRVLLLGGGSRINLVNPDFAISDPVAAVDVFDPTSGRIVDGGHCSTDAMPGSEPLCLQSPRLREVVGAIGQGHTLVAGGETETGPALQPEWLFSGTSSFDPQDPHPEALDAALVTGSESAWLLGGRQSSDIVDLVHVFTGSGEHFAIDETLSCPRAEASVAVANGRALLFGGKGVDEKGEEVFEPTFEVVRFEDDITFGGCETLDVKVVPTRAGAVATVVNENLVLLTGGMEPSGIISDDIYLFDFRSSEICNVGSMRNRRHLHTSVLLPEGEVLVIGGAGGAAGETPLYDSEIFSLAEILEKYPQDGIPDCEDLTEDEVLIPLPVMTGPTLRSARIGSTATLLDNGMILIAGGFDESGEALATYEVFIPFGSEIPSF